MIYWYILQIYAIKKLFYRFSTLGNSQTMLKLRDFYILLIQFHTLLFFFLYFFTHLHFLTNPKVKSGRVVRLS